MIVLERAYRKSETRLPESGRHNHFLWIDWISPILSFSLIPHLIAVSADFLQHFILQPAIHSVGYGYAILRFRLLGIDKTVHRGARTRFS